MVKQKNSINPWSVIKIAELRDAVQRGNVCAAIDAMWLCDKMKISPRWLKEAVIEHLGKTLTHHGRKLIDRRIKDHIRCLWHFERWRAVQHARGEKVASSDLFSIVSERLVGTNWAGTENAIAISYKMVSKALNDPDRRHQYYSPRKKTLKMLGLGTLSLPWKVT